MSQLAPVISSRGYTASPMGERIPIDVAAEQYHVARSSIFRWISRQRLTRYKKAGDNRTYIDRDQLRRLLELQPDEPEDAPA